MTGSVEDAYTVTYDEEEDEYVVEGPKIEKMLGYTNLDSEKGFTFFQNFLKDTGILEELEALVSRRAIRYACTVCPLITISKFVKGKDRL